MILGLNAMKLLSEQTCYSSGKWKHILGVLIKWQWHLLGTYYSYPVAFITSALEEKTSKH